MEDWEELRKMPSNIEFEFIALYLSIKGPNCASPQKLYGRDGTSFKHLNVKNQELLPKSEWTTDPLSLFLARYPISIPNSI